MTAALVALTSYYNPFHGLRRRRNYHLFRKLLGVPLVTVEWAIDGRFDLSPGDADVMLRVEGGDLMWQKERLLNRGLAHIRAAGLARDVVMIDADAVFTDAGWADRVSAALDGCPVAQCYSHLDYLPPVPDDTSTLEQLLAVTPESSVPSLACAVAQGAGLFTTDPAIAQALAIKDHSVSGNPGMSIALRLAQLPHFELYEGNIVGAGDFALVSACLGALEELFRHRAFSAAHADDLRAWVARCLPVRECLGCADNRLTHLWHGTLEARQYGRRMGILASQGYDPVRDLDRGGEALRFSESATELKAAIGAYLASRDDA